MDKISVTPIKKILSSKINSKSIFTYFFLVAMAEEKNEQAVIMNVNPHRIYTVMRENNIPTSHVQICISLSELEEAGLLEYNVNISTIKQDKSVILLPDACIDFKKGTGSGFVYLSEMLLTKMFYDLSVRAKRLFLYVYKHFIANRVNLQEKQFIRNILKKENQTELFEILRVNRYQKVRDTINELSYLLNISCLSQNNKNEIYKFTLSKGFLSSLLTKSATTEHGEVVKNSVIKPVETSNTWLRLQKVIKDFSTPFSTYEIKEIFKATCFFNLSFLKRSINSYIKLKNKRETVKNIYDYFKAIEFSAI